MFKSSGGLECQNLVDFSFLGEFFFLLSDFLFSEFYFFLHEVRGLFIAQVLHFRVNVSVSFELLAREPSSQRLETSKRVLLNVNEFLWLAEYRFQRI